MKAAHARIAKTVGLITILTAAYGIYQKLQDAENLRLKEIAERHFEDFSIPAESTFIYQETEVSRTCKTASITKLFSINDQPERICKLVYLPLQASGWKSYDGCRVNSYPYAKNKAHVNGPSYISSRLDASSPEGDFSLSISAMPSNAWGDLFMLSTFGTQEAIPLARISGASFYTVKIRYTENRVLLNQRCSEFTGRCDCIPATLFEWQFPDGRINSRSN